MASTKGKTYIAGPMRGEPGLNYDRFNLVAAYLREEYTDDSVFNPAEAFDGDQSRPLKDYFRKDFAALATCTAIVFLPGWQNSPGSRIEYLIAKELGLQMYAVLFTWTDPDDIDATEQVASIELLGDNDVPVELEAGRIVRNGERQAVYGHPNQDFKRTAALWDVLGFGTEDKPEDVALAQICLKLSRLRGTPRHRDSIVDIIGYAICYDRIMREDNG